MKKKWLVTLMIILALSILVACTEEDETKEDPEEIVPVETTEVNIGDLITEKTSHGRVSPKKMAPVMAGMVGEVDTLEVANGDEVEEDDLIATIKTPMGEQEIKAPVAGEVMNIEVDEGDITTEEDPIAMIVDMEELTIEFSVTDRIRSLFDADETYTVEVNKEEYKVTIDTIHSLPNDTGLYTVETTIKNKNRQILPGMVGKIILPEKKTADVLLLPTEAIMEDSEGSYLYMIKDGEAVRKAVDIIERQSNQTAFDGEVEEGDEVIINGQLTVSDGQRIEVVEEENAS